MIDTEFHAELIDPEAFIAPGSFVCGTVIVGPGASLWFGAIARGDTERIEIGGDTNVQDGCILHADPGFPCILGQRVTLGHGAIVHGATVEDDSLIGIRATVLNGARVGSGSIVAAGALVPEGMQVPPGHLVMGMPAKIVRPCTPQDRDRIIHAAKHYVEAAKVYKRTPFER